MTMNAINTVTTMTATISAETAAESSIGTAPNAHRKRKRLLTNPWFSGGLAVAIIIVATCLAAPLLTHYAPNDIDLNSLEAAPSSAHLLGTDSLGRDIFSRLLYGGRMSILVGVAAVAIQVVIGVALGTISGYFRGAADAVIMRVAEIFQCFPFYPLAITIAAVFGANVWNVVLIIGLLQWPGLARLVRGEVLSIRENAFIDYSRAIGVPTYRILWEGLVRNCVPVIVVNATLAVTTAILSEAALSFLGLGVSQPDPSWGNMLSSAQSFRVLSYEPWMWIPPGIAIALLVLSINAIGESLQEYLRPRFGYITDILPSHTAKHDSHHCMKLNNVKDHVS